MYEPTIESVRQHPVPDWYHDAKFGIFIHWTISSVPAFAPTGLGDINTIMKEKSQEFMFAHQPYVEWYQNSLRIPGSPVQQYHAGKYGPDFPFEAFSKTFDEQSQQWNPEQWARLFQRAGARYVVLVTKHHDGFLLWPSHTPNPFMPDFHTSRDVVGELTEAVSSRGMKMGLYYSSALDWTFTREPIQNFVDLIASGPASRRYTDYIEKHWIELIDRYDPWVLWSDIGYPPNYNLARLFAYFYNKKPEGVVNDRWFQLPAFLRNPLAKFVLRQAVKRMMQSSNAAAMPKVPHCDFVTTEYVDFDSQVPFKWESCRGIGNSFGYNQFEKPEDYLKAPALIRMLADIVSKNGNLLLNVGPRPDGSIPEPQIAALEGLGRWLETNGEAIYETRPWTQAEDTGENGLAVRYTCKDTALFAILTSLPSDGQVGLSNPPAGNLQVRLLGNDQPVEWYREGERLVVRLPADLQADSVPVLRLDF